MLFGCCPHEDTALNKLIEKKKSRVINFPLSTNPVSKGTCDLLERMLQQSPNNRIDTETLHNVVCNNAQLEKLLHSPETQKFAKNSLSEEVESTADTNMTNSVIER